MDRCLCANDRERGCFCFFSPTSVHLVLFVVVQHMTKHRQWKSASNSIIEHVYIVRPVKKYSRKMNTIFMIYRPMVDGTFIVRYIIVRVD